VPPTHIALQLAGVRAEAVQVQNVTAEPHEHALFTSRGLLARTVWCALGAQVQRSPRRKGDYILQIPKRAPRALVAAPNNPIYPFSPSGCSVGRMLQSGTWPPPASNSLRSSDEAAQHGVEPNTLAPNQAVIQAGVGSRSTAVGTSTRRDEYLP
jgi:hypothetical protein